MFTSSDYDQMYADGVKNSNVRMKDKLIRKTSRRYNIPGHAHHLTFSCFKRQPFLTNPEYCNLLIYYIKIARLTHTFDIWAYVIMPDHVHLLIYPKMPEYFISKILKSIKQPASQAIIHSLMENKEFSPLHKMETGEIARPYRFWQAGGGYDRNIYSSKEIIDAIEYIHNNPVRRKLISHPSEWKYSSFQSWLNPAQGPISLDLESIPHLI